jgi:hypothetical protein
VNVQVQQTPKRRALGDITNSRSNAKPGLGTPAGASKGLGSSVKAASVSKISVFTPKKVEAVEDVDTASRMADPEMPFSDATLEASLGLLLAAEAGSELRVGGPLLPDTLDFRPAELEDAPESAGCRPGEDDGMLAMLLEEEEDDARLHDFDLDALAVRDDASD